MQCSQQCHRFFFFFFLIYFEDLALNGRSICSEQHSINTAMDFAVGAFEGRKAFSHQGLLRWNMRCVCCVGQRPLLSYSGDRTMQKNERIMQQTTGIVFQRALKKQRVLALKLWYLYPPSTPRCLFFFVENHAVHNKRATCQESQATLPSGVVEQCKKWHKQDSTMPFCCAALPNGLSTPGTNYQTNWRDELMNSPRIEPMHCFQWGCSHLFFNSSTKSPGTTKMVFVDKFTTNLFGNSGRIQFVSGVDGP